MSCTATDTASNTTTVQVPYRVVYGFSGFAGSVDGDGVLNRAKAGQTIPLKWSLHDANGAPVTGLMSAKVSTVSTDCTSGAGIDPVEEYASGSSGLQNLGGGNHQFNWKTPKAYAGTCKTLQLTLGDGTVYTAQFQFT